MSKLILPKRRSVISRRSLLIAAPVVILSRKLNAQGCGGGFCQAQQSAAQNCMSPTFRDWSNLTTPVPIISNASITPAPCYIANCFEVRPENQIGGVTFAFTENQTSSSGPATTDAIGIWTSNNGIYGPWTSVGNAVTGGGSYNFNQLYGPSVKEIPKGSGIFRLYYSSSNNISQFSISYAYSTTMMPGSWTQFSGNPVIPTTGGPGYADPFVLDHPSGSGHIMYVAENYPGGRTIQYFTSPDGDTWTFGGTSLAAPTSPSDPDYGIHSIDEPTVWKNKYCFYEMIFDYNDIHNAYGQGSRPGGYAISADGLTFTMKDPNNWPNILFGFGNCRIIQQDGLLYAFTDINPDFSGVYGGASGLCTIPDVI